MISLLKIFNDFKDFRRHRKNYSSHYNIDYFYATENIDNYIITVKAEGIRKDDILLEFIRSSREKKVVVTFKQNSHIPIKRTEIYIVGLDGDLAEAQAHLCNSNLVIVIPKDERNATMVSAHAPKTEELGLLEEIIEEV